MNLTKIGLRWFIFSIITAILNFAGIVYFSRVLGARALGIYFLFLSTLTVFNLFTNMGLSAATIKRLSEGGKRSEIATASLMLRLGAFGICAVIVLIFKNQLNSYIGTDLSYFLLFILGLTQFSEIIREILHGEQKVDTGGAYDLIQQFLRTASQSLLILFGFEVFGLIIGMGIGIFISVIIGSKLVSVGIKVPEKSHFKSLLTYSKFSFGNAIGGYLYEWADIAIIGFFLTQQFVGIYGIAWGLSAAFLILSNAVTSSIYPMISELSTKGEKQKIGELFSESLIYSPMLVIPALFGTLVISESLLGTVFGEEFKKGYLVLIILMLTRVFQSAQMVSVRTLEGMDLPNLVFKVNIATTILNIFGVVTLVYLFGFVGAAIGTMLTIFASFFWNTIIVCRLLKVSIPFRDIVLEIFSAAVMGVIIFGISKFLPVTTFPNLIITVLTGGTAYFIVLLFMSKRIQSKCLLILKEVVRTGQGAADT
ncbi:MAG: oligosaccharide flippase family protein [Candidatus Methanoperedens sp.]|nr:oligosaccharide flippase family protein [Candidatus Methanoperedens sp.]